MKTKTKFLWILALCVMLLDRPWRLRVLRLYIPCPCFVWQELST